MVFKIIWEFCSQILHFLLMFWRMKQHICRKYHWHTNQKSLNKVRLILVLDKSQTLCRYQQMLQYQLHSPSCPDSMRQTAKQNTRRAATDLSYTYCLLSCWKWDRQPTKQKLLSNRVCNDTVIALDCAIKNQEHSCPLTELLFWLLQTNH